MKKPMIELHDPIVYPRKLWVADKIEGLDKVFSFMKIADPYTESPTSYDSILNDSRYIDSGMITIPVMRISDGLYGVLVVAIDLKDITPDMIPHESVHVADYIYSQLGIFSQDFTEGNEAYAYLVGWAASCISKSISNFKKDLYDDIEQ
jgi:hypothetical protein